MQKELSKKLLFPLGSDLQEAIEMICNSEVGQFYTGLANERFGGCSISHHYSPAGCFSREELSILLRLAEQHHRSVSIAVNVTFWNEDVWPWILDDLRFLSQYQIDHLILGDLELYYRIKQHFPKQKCAASSLFGIKNVHAAAFFYEMGFEKIIFPRNVSLREIEAVCKAFKDKLQIECFVFGGGCAYCEGTCSLPHIFKSGMTGDLKEDLCHISPTPICSFPVEFYENGRFESVGRIDHGFRGCGLCYIPYFDKLGVSSLKITGRTMPTDRRSHLMQRIEEALQHDHSNCPLEKKACMYEKQEY